MVGLHPLCASGTCAGKASGYFCSISVSSPGCVWDGV